MSIPSWIIALVSLVMTIAAFTTGERKMYIKIFSLASASVFVMYTLLTINDFSGYVSLSYEIRNLIATTSIVTMLGSLIAITICTWGKYDKQ